MDVCHKKLHVLLVVLAIIVYKKGTICKVKMYVKCPLNSNLTLCLVHASMPRHFFKQLFLIIKCRSCKRLQNSFFRFNFVHKGAVDPKQVCPTAITVSLVLLIDSVLLLLKCVITNCCKYCPLFSLFLNASAS